MGWLHMHIALRVLQSITVPKLGSEFRLIGFRGLEICKLGQKLRASFHSGSLTVPEYRVLPHTEPGSQTIVVAENSDDTSYLSVAGMWPKKSESSTPAASQQQLPAKQAGIYVE